MGRPKKRNRLVGSAITRLFAAERATRRGLKMGRVPPRCASTIAALLDACRALLRGLAT